MHEHGEAPFQIEETLLPIEVVSSVDSTNAELLRRAATGQSQRQILIAESQTAGYGRSGRRWVSPARRNLYFSCLWHFEEGIEILRGLSLAVGVAVVDAIEKLAGVRLGLKWPNDVMDPRGKLGGVLIESASRPGSGCCVVIGVGLNVGMTDSDIADVDQPCTSINALTESACCRSALAARLTANLVPLLEHYPRVGFSNWRERWNTLDVLSGQPVMIDTPRGVVEGVARGVADDGGLLVETLCGSEVFYAGEVRLRKTNVGIASAQPEQP